MRSKNGVPMGDQLAYARIRLYDASGCYPLRTLRVGKDAYETSSRWGEEKDGDQFSIDPRPF